MIILPRTQKKSYISSKNIYNSPKTQDQHEGIYQN